MRSKVEVSGPASTSLKTIGAHLVRPECVLATADGSFYVSMRGRGVARVDTDGRCFALAERTEHGGMEIVPNGIALLPDGSFLLANIADAGGILRLVDGRIEPFVTTLNDRPMPPVNFVTTDEDGRIWFSISSTTAPRHLAYRRDVANGLIGTVEDGRAQIVARGLHYTNEIRPDLENGWLYVSETFGFAITRFPLAPDGTLGEKAEFASVPDGSFVDGIALDAEGCVWSASIVSNEVRRTDPHGRSEVMLAETDRAWVSEVIDALDRGQMGRRHFDEVPTKTLRNAASLAFHGEDLTRLAAGSLLGDRIVTFETETQGRRPVHWEVTVSMTGTEFTSRTDPE